jgi:hypothetical protein
MFHFQFSFYGWGGSAPPRQAYRAAFMTFNFGLAREKCYRPAKAPRY